MSRSITLAQLVKLGACEDQLEKFQQRFGDSVEITPALCESVAPDFNFDFVAKHLFSAPAFAEYERVTAAAGDEFERVAAAALAEYKRIRARALAKYKRVRAQAFAELYNHDLLTDLPRDAPGV